MDLRMRLEVVAISMTVFVRQECYKDSNNNLNHHRVNRVQET